MTPTSCPQPEPLPRPPPWSRRPTERSAGREERTRWRRPHLPDLAYASRDKNIFPFVRIFGVVHTCCVSRPRFSNQPSVRPPAKSGRSMPDELVVGVRLIGPRRCTRHQLTPHVPQCCSAISAGLVLPSGETAPCDDRRGSHWLAFGCRCAQELFGTDDSSIWHPGGAGVVHQ